MDESQIVEITTEVVAALVADQFPNLSGRSIRQVDPGGWDNRTFRLGNDLLVRLPSHARYAAQVEKEQRWLPVLGPQLPLPIPVPVAQGRPALGYPWSWSVYRWLDGEPVNVANIADTRALAEELAEFLRALQSVEPSGGPAPGRHNFFRGGSLLTYEDDTRRAIADLEGRVDTRACTRLWDEAIAVTYTGPDAWLHGDVAASNLLVRDGQLCAVLDFGAMAVGDVACDLTIAWTLFGGDSRRAFRERMALDEATWARARGWALWKALILLAWGHGPTHAVADAARVLDAVLSD
jgi:aminoglycoside phosphotransferase (APT) family kinase protein